MSAAASPPLLAGLSCTKAPPVQTSLRSFSPLQFYKPAVSLIRFVKPAFAAKMLCDIHFKLFFAYRVAQPVNRSFFNLSDTFFA